jgi:hypothetical protein
MYLKIEIDIEVPKEKEGLIQNYGDAMNYANAEIKKFLLDKKDINEIASVEICQD